MARSKKVRKLVELEKQMHRASRETEKLARKFQDDLGALSPPEYREYMSLKLTPTQNEAFTNLQEGQTDDDAE